MLSTISVPTRTILSLTFSACGPIQYKILSKAAGNTLLNKTGSNQKNMDTQRTGQLLTLIANKCKSQADYDNTSRLVLEILDTKRAIVRIGANDIENTFQTGGDIHGFTISVSAASDDRMKVLTEDVRKKAEHFKPYNHVIMLFFMSETCPLTMDELLPLNEWQEEFPDDAMFRWGVAINPPNSPHTLKAVVLIQ